MKNIPISGSIVPDDDVWIYNLFGIPCTSPKAVKKELQEANGEEVTIEINSGGGDLFAGNEIYYAIHEYKGQTTADITGLAASAATVIACGANVVRASPGMQYMIHNVSAGAQGDYHAMDHMSEILQNANRAVTNIYRLKTGMNETELLDLMNWETWMEAKRALELHFVDEIIGDKGGVLAKPITLYNAAAIILPEEVKAKVRASIKSEDPDILLQKNKLDILKLKGERRREI